MRYRSGMRIEEHLLDFRHVDCELVEAGGNGSGCYHLGDAQSHASGSDFVAVVKLARVINYYS